MTMVERPNSVTFFYFIIYIDFISSLIIWLSNPTGTPTYPNGLSWNQNFTNCYNRGYDRTTLQWATMIPYDTKLLALGSRHPLFFWILKFLLNRCSHYAYQLPTFSPTLIIKSPITIFINTCTIIFTGFRQSSPFCPSKVRSQPNGTYAGSGQTPFGTSRSVCYLRTSTWRVLQTLAGSGSFHPANLYQYTIRCSSPS